jgi:hypothetical protein
MGNHQVKNKIHWESLQRKAGVGLEFGLLEEGIEKGTLIR